MRAGRFLMGSSRPGLALVLLFILLAILTVGGGASRPQVFGQVIVRWTAWLLLIVAILFGTPPNIRAGRPVVLLLAAAVLLSLLQIVPLPPSLWMALPGRHLIIQAAAAVGEPQPWRPLSIVPAATINAAFSLIVPVTTLWLALSLKDDERQQLPGPLLCLMLGSTLVGLIQINTPFNNLFVNQSRGAFSGTFANGNHFALQMAIGCALAPAWYLHNSRSVPRSIVGLASVLLFIVAILVSGSRAGLFLGGVGIALGFLLGVSKMKDAFTRRPRWVFPVMVVGIVGIVASLVLVSVAAGRVDSINRLFENDPGQELRIHALPTIWSMLLEYFPVGSGLGSFDPIFRIHEPFGLLKPTFFNHAHNDFIEVIVDAGLPGLLLLLAALCWWGWASVRAWRAGSERNAVLPKTGSAILLLVFLASIVDYPARTPMIMAWIVLAAVWLAGSHTNRRESETIAP